VAVYANTRSVQLSGLITICQWLPRILLLPLAGGVLDRFGIRSQLLAIEALRIMLATVLIVGQVGEPAVLLIGAVSLLNGCCYLGLESITAGLVTADRRVEFQSKIQSIDRTSRVVGPAIGGWLLVTRGLDAVALASASFFLASLAILGSRFAANYQRSDSPFRLIVPEAGAALRHILRTRPLLTLSCIVMCSNVIDGALSTLLPKFVITTLHGSTSTIARLEVFTAVLTIGALRLLPSVLRRRDMNLQKCFLPALLLMYASPIACVLCTSIAWFAASYAMFFICQSVVLLHVRVERLAYLPAATFSATMGVLVSLLQATVPLSGFLILATADTISSETFVVLASLLCLLASVMFAKKFKELKRGKNDDKRNGEREPA
jgi:hypothetical protein